MKFTLVLLVLAFFVSNIAADFHIIQGIASGGGQGVVSCPSDYYKCKCYKDGERAGVVTDGNEGIASLENRNFFQMKAGLCGMSKLNFYKQGDGSWKFYVNNGDGKEQGTCYSTKYTTSCSPGFFFIDRLICYSYICNA